MATERIILGIDPGTTIMGYAIIQVKAKSTEVLAIGVIELKKFSDHYLKLKRIFERTVQLIDQYHPDEMAIEAPFFGKNVQSMLKLGRGQGVAMAAALSRSIPIFEYSPRKIKMSITGTGTASKEQVAAMLKGILKLTDMPEHLDATDGLAAAVCHSYQRTVTDGEEPVKSWKDFIAKNPKRIQK